MKLHRISYKFYENHSSLKLLVILRKPQGNSVCILGS